MLSELHQLNDGFVNNISADTATINGNITLNDASSNLSLSNHSEKTANAILNGDVSSKGGISLSNQNIIQESGNFKSVNSQESVNRV